MSTQTRLDNYLAAEEKILKAQEVRGNDTTFRRAELSDVQSMIDKLQLQLSRETSSAASGSLRHSLANLNRSTQ